MKNKNIFLQLFFSKFCVAIILAIIFVSCSSTDNLYSDIDKKVYNKEYEAAIETVKSKQEKLYDKNDKVVATLEYGELNFAGKFYQQSIDTFNTSESLIKEYYTASISQKAASILMNDRKINYSGEDFEDIYTNIYKALAFAQLQKGDEALVEIRRINNKLSLLGQKYAKYDSEAKSVNSSVQTKKTNENFNNSALARYISVVLQRDIGNADEARISKKEMEAAFKTQASLYPFAVPKITATKSNPKATSLPINIVSLQGSSPIKKAVNIYVQADGNAIYIGTKVELNAEDKQVLGGFSIIPWRNAGNWIAYTQVPIMYLRETKISKTKVFVDEKEVGELQPVEDIEKIAVQSFRKKMPLIYIKTITRVVAKQIASQAIAKQKGKDGVILGLAATAATERADLRISRYMNANAQVGEFVLPVGKHSLEVVYFDKSGNEIDRTKEDIDVGPGKINLFHALSMK
ncbi:MAG: hypothetical protein ACRCSK_07015 [Fusobacteriaceae bacterium]